MPMLVGCDGRVVDLLVVIMGLLGLGTESSNGLENPRLSSWNDKGELLK